MACGAGLVKFLLTESDRRKLEALAWQAVRFAPFPRPVRVMARDRLVLRWLEEQQRESGATSPATPPASSTPPPSP